MTTEITVDLALVAARAPLRALANVTLRWTEDELTIRRCAVFEKLGEPHCDLLATGDLPIMPEF